MSVKGTDYTEVTENLFGTVVTIPDTIAVHDLGVGGGVSSPTKTICRLDDIGAKYLQTERPKTSLLNSQIN